MPLIKPTTLCAFCLALGLAWPVPCAAGGDALIWQRIRTLLDQGRELAACRQALKLKPYKGSQGYQKAAAALRRHGISIESPLQSYTVKRMVDLQNATEKLRQSSGQAPKVGPRAGFRDAWGRPLRIEHISMKSYLYIIRSAGPDGRFLSHDDLVLGMRADDAALNPAYLKKLGRKPNQASPRPLSGQPDLTPGRSGPGRRPLPLMPGYGQRRRPSGGAAESRRPPQGTGERSVTLDELLKGGGGR